MKIGITFGKESNIASDVRRMKAGSKGKKVCISVKQEKKKKNNKEEKMEKDVEEEAERGRRRRRRKKRSRRKKSRPGKY